MRLVDRQKLLFSLFLYLLAFGIRLYGITTASPQVDELTWRHRSQKVLKLWQRGDYRHLTSYELGHPGVPPAVIMAAGVKAAAVWDRLGGLDATDRFYLDPLSGARIANASFSSLIAPIVFVFAGMFFPARIAVLTGLLAATDVQLVAHSRLAHLDAFLTVFSTLSLFLYALSIIKRRTSLKLLAGVCWGLAVCTKVSAVAMLPVFLLFKLLRLLLIKEKDPREEWALITWSDIWALLLGQAAIAATYTRLWWFRNDYRTRLGVRNIWADWAYRHARELHEHVPFAAAALVLALFAAALCLWLLYRRYSGAKKRWAFHAAVSGFTLACCLGVYVLFPPVVQNLILLWTRTFGLRNLAHRSFGHTWPAPSYGYPGLYLSRVSVLLIFSFLAGCVFLFARARRMLTDKEGEKQVSILSFMVLNVIVWPAVLSVSKKQAFRYVLAVLPSACLVSAFGIAAIWDDLRRAVDKTRVQQTIHPAYRRLSLYALILLHQSLILGFAYPDYLLFFNDLSGGIKAAYARHNNFALAGLDEALTWLNAKTSQGPANVQVAMIGDKNVITNTFARKFPDTRSRISLYFTEQFQNTEYVLLLHGHEDLISADGLAELKQYKEAFSYKIDGVSLTSIYEVPEPDYKKPEYRLLAPSFRKTGRIARSQRLFPGLPGAEEVLYAVPGRDRKDWMFFNQNIALVPGEHSFVFYLGTPAETRLPPSDETAMLIEVGSACSYPVKTSALKPGQIDRVRFNCSVSEPGKYQVRGFWTANVPLAVQAFSREPLREDRSR